MEAQQRFSTYRSARHESSDLNQRNPYGSPTASVLERTKMFNQRQNLASQTDDLFTDLPYRQPYSFSPAELYSDSSFDIDPLDELDALANELDDQEWRREYDDDYDDLPELSTGKERDNTRTIETPSSAAAIPPRSPTAIPKTVPGVARQDDGILWPFMRPTGEILYEKVAFCLFMAIFIVKETVFAMVAYADMLVCTLVLNTGLFFLHRLRLCRDRGYINPLRLLKRRERSQAIFKVIAAAIYLWIGIVLVVKNKDNHIVRTSLTSPDLEAIRAAVQYVLPSYVPLNPKTGKVDLTGALSDEYVRRAELPIDLSNPPATTASLPTWQEFMKNNNHALEAFVEQAIGKYWQQFLDQNNPTMENFVQRLVEKHATKQGYIRHKYDPAAPEDDQTPTAIYVANALQKYHQDMLGIPDFALATRGSRIIPRLTSETYDPRPFWRARIANIFGAKRTLRQTPLIALLPDTNVGQCWPMAGATGSLGIMLSDPVIVRAVTVEYPSREMGVNMTSAPKDIEVWGLPRDGYKETTDTKSLVFLGSFRYDISKNAPVQTFSVQMQTSVIIKSVLFRFTSNWGQDAYTCIYRVRVHGDIV